MNLYLLKLSFNNKKLLIMIKELKCNYIVQLDFYIYIYKIKKINSIILNKSIIYRKK